MAATKIARNNSYAGFDEFVNMPGSPTLVACSRLAPASAQTPAAAATAASSSSSPSTAAGAASTTANVSVAAFNMRKVGLDEKQPPPPPGSSPEVLFRYYLAVELRKAGTQPDEALLDRYVRNHFDSLFKNKPTSAQAPPTTTQTQTQASPSHATVAAVPRPATVPRKTALTMQSSTAAASTSAQPATLSTHNGSTEMAGAGPHASSSVLTDAADEASLPELDAADSPAFSGRSHSAVATPSAEEGVETMGAIDLLAAFNDPSSSLLGSSSFTGVASADAAPMVKFENEADQALSFFRTSPFRMADFESATIDPHVVEKATGTAQPFSMPRAAITAPAVQTSCDADEVAPMSEDGMSEDEDPEAKDELHGLDADDADDAAFFKALGAGSKPLNTIPMAVGSMNHLKPDPEEYKKLSSKEKRQLRNKISARNFRTRRKEYITLLEEQLADRDSIIEGLRQQLSLMTTENKTLKEEVRIIKTRTISSQDVGKILDALQSMAPINTTLAAGASVGSTPSGRLSPVSAAGSAGTSSDFGAHLGPATPSAFVNFLGDSSRPTTPTLVVPSSPVPSSPRPSLLRRPSVLPQPNTKKDVAPSSSFWGGVGNAANTNSFMPVC